MRALKFAMAVASGAMVMSMGSVWASGNRPVDIEAANLRIAPVASVKLAPASKAGGKERTGEELYKAACTACHATGVAGAPKTGDSAAWAPRIKLGLDALVKSALAGKNAMPPKGGSDANENEMKAAIVFIANQSGANFK